MLPRVVADTNFWVAAAGWSGSAHRLYLELVAGRFIHVTSFEILNEINRVLRRLPGFTEPMVYEWYCEIGVHSELITAQPPTEGRITICRDADDNKLLECAVWGRATYLITRDKDLLTLDGYRGYALCSRRVFGLCLKRVAMVRSDESIVVSCHHQPSTSMIASYTRSKV